MMDALLEQACEALVATAQKGLAWIADPVNDAQIGQERATLERSLRNQAYRADRLKHSLDRPMSVGVFGPSQAGKSYLVSVFARKGGSLVALFDDRTRPEVDFIAEINPYGEKEATGLVTRFSMTRPKTPQGYPVALRLLSQTDILKIIVNSYFVDGDQQEETPPTYETIDAHIAGFEKQIAAAPLAALREEDIWDVEDYFQRQLRRTETRVFGPFWDRFARVAPRLALPERAGLFSILWGRHEPLTALFLKLCQALESLGFAENVYCPLSALTPAVSGILNVETLQGLDGSIDETVDVAADGGRSAVLPRPIVTALAAELRIAMKDQPWPLFDHTDLLDFPGYRGRALHNIGKYLRESGGNALKELFLRGKVDYLFQRYCAEQELTSMLLCIPPSNLDVTSLPAVVEDWIGLTHGRSPADRRGRAITLFFLLTKFDQHLADKIVDEAPGSDDGLRFKSRLEASLVKPFGRSPNSWPLNWADGQPFRNCFWIRNPNYKAEGVIRYEGRREMEILPPKIERVAQLKAGCVGVEEIGQHFLDPGRAFDEAMKLNDGGVSYLAENLALVCKPGMKQAQVRARIADLRKRVVESLAPYYVPTDAEKRVQERTAVAEGVGPEFNECYQRQEFGLLLRIFCVDRAGLADAIYESRTRNQATAAEPALEKAQPSPRTTGIMADVFAAGGVGKSAPMRSQAGTAPAARPSVTADSLARPSPIGVATRMKRSRTQTFAPISDFRAIP